MRKNNNIVVIFTVLVLAGALCRFIPGMPWGFAPQVAMAIFSGSVVKNRKLSFALPLLSMFISDLLFQGAYSLGITATAGFYSGQWINYLLFAALTMVGWLINEKKVLQIAIGALTGPVLYFFASNSATWIGGGGYNRPKTWDGYLLCLNDGLPFFRGSLFATVIFSVVFFGGYALWQYRRHGAPATERN